MGYVPPTLIFRHPDAGWEDRPTFYVETRSPITPKLQVQNPSKNKARFRYGIGGLREVWDKPTHRNKWVFPLSEGEEITPDDDETFIVVGGSEISREECREMVAYMRQKSNQRRANRLQQRPTPQQVSDALRELAAKRLQMGKHIRQFVVPRGAAAQAMADVAKSGLGMR